MVRLFAILLAVSLALSVNAQEKKPDGMSTKKTYEKVDRIHREAIGHARKQEYDQALRKFREALKIQDNSTRVLIFNMAVTYELANQPKKAIKAFVEAARRKKDFKVAWRKASKLECENGMYADGVKHGDTVLKLDPDDTKVKVWLPECRKQLALLMAKKPPPKKEKKPEKKKPEEKKKDDKPPEHYIIEVGYDFMYPSRWDRDTRTTTTHEQAGTLKYPQKAYVTFEPSPQMRLHLYAGVPYLGLMHPNFLTREGYLEFTLRPGGFIIGAAALYTEGDLTSDVVPAPRGSDDGEFMQNGTSTVADFKWGPVLGTKSDSSQFLLYILPRYLFRDKETGSGTAIDRVLLGAEYRSFPGKDAKGLAMGMAFGLKVEEIYVTEYGVGNNEDENPLTGSFFGTYDAYFEIEFGSTKPKKGSKVSLSFGLGYTARFYFQEIGDTDPFQYFNGQGYGGIDVRTELGKVKWPGYRSNSHIFKIFSKQLLFYHVFLKEFVEIEVSHASEKANGIYGGMTVAAKF